MAKNIVEMWNTTYDRTLAYSEANYARKNEKHFYEVVGGNTTLEYTPRRQDALAAYEKARSARLYSCKNGRKFLIMSK